MRRCGERDAVDLVAQRQSPGAIGSDIVALNDIAGSGGTVDVDSPLIGRDHVAGRGGGAADRVGRGPFDQHAVVRVAAVGGARLVDADVVPLDQVSCAKMNR